MQFEKIKKIQITFREVLLESLGKERKDLQEKLKNKIKELKKECKKNTKYNKL